MDKYNLSLEKIRTFVRVVERGNFSQAAKELNIAQPSVTRHINELEKSLDAALLKRTTRSIAVTAEGERFYQRCLHILKQLDDAISEVQTKTSELKGQIKLSCTTAFGIQHLCPILHSFMERYPQIELDVNLTDHQVDLVTEGVDFVVRLAPLSNSSLKYRKLGDSERLLVASPEFLEQHGPLNVPKDLSGLNAIRMRMVGDNGKVSLVNSSEEPLDIPISGKFLIDNGLAARDALKAGKGFGVTHRWLVQDQLDNGELIHLFPEYSVAPIPLSILIAPERTNVTRVRCLIEYIVEHTKMIPGIGETK